MMFEAAIATTCFFAGPSCFLQVGSSSFVIRLNLQINSHSNLHRFLEQLYKKTLWLELWVLRIAPSHSCHSADSPLLFVSGFTRFLEASVCLGQS